jgi:hypothetical protein
MRLSGPWLVSAGRGSRPCHATHWRTTGERIPRNGDGINPAPSRSGVHRAGAREPPPRASSGRACAAREQKIVDEKIRGGWAYAGPQARKNCLTASSVTAAFVRGITQCLTVPVTSREPASRRRGCTRPPSRVIPCTRICWPVSQRQIGVVRRKEPVGIGAVRSKPIRGASGQIPKRSGESRS